MSVQVVGSSSLDPSRQCQAAVAVVMETHQRLVNILISLVVADLLFVGGLLAWSALDEDSGSPMENPTAAAKPGPASAQARAEGVKPQVVAQEEAPMREAQPKQEKGEGATVQSSAPTIASEMLNPIEDAFLTEPQRRLLNDHGIK